MSLNLFFCVFILTVELACVVWFFFRYLEGYSKHKADPTKNLDWKLSIGFWIYCCIVVAAKITLLYIPDEYGVFLVVGTLNWYIGLAVVIVTALVITMVECCISFFRVTKPSSMWETWTA